jgi:hypothetical protein
MRNLLLALAFTGAAVHTCTPDATAQVATYHLEQDFGLRWDAHVHDIGTKYTLTEAKTKYGKWYARWVAEGQVDPVTYPGRTDANFMLQSEFVAAFNEAIWRNHAAGHINPSNNTLILCQSRSNVNAGAGRYVVDLPNTLGHGNYTGHGSSGFYTNGGSSTTGTIAQGGTELVLDVAGWLGNPNEMFIFRSSTWGRDELQSYQEAFSLNKFRLVGGSTQANNTGTKLQAGVAAWDMGSVSSINYIFAENFGTAGFYFVRGTPGTINTITSFRNGLAGVLIEGGGMFNFQGTCEFDENPAMFHTRSGHGRPGWCSVSATAVKGETGLAPGREIPVFQALLVSEEGGDYHFSKVDYAAVNSFPHHLVYINPKVNASMVKVGLLHLFGPCYALVHDAKAGKLWRTDGQVNKNGYWGTRTKDFVYESGGGGNLYTSTVTVTPIAAGSTRMSGLLVDNNTGGPIGTWDHVAGTPAYQYLGASGPPPPPPPPPPATCTYTTSNWGPCVNGIEVRTVTSSPQGCTGTPPSTTRPCTVAPPPPPPPPPPAPTTPDPLRATRIAVVINSDDPASEAIGTYYLSKRPGARVVRVRLGNADQQTNLTTVTTARTAIAAALPDSVSALALCFTKPTRVGTAGDKASASTRNASINYAITHPFTATTNMLAKWTSTARTAGVVYSTAQVDAATVAHKAGQYGTQYAISCWDAPSQGNPRGGAVATGWSTIQNGTLKLPVPHQWTDARPLANTNWGANFLQGKTDVIGYWTGIGNTISNMETNTVLRGAIADNITSYGGRLGDHGGQQSILAFTTAGYLMVTGTVVEPYQSATGNSTGSLVEQFMDPRKALPMWLGGKSAAEVYRASVLCPVRSLGIFDPYVAPYAGVTLTPPGTGGGTPPPTGGAGFSTSFDGTGCTIGTGVTQTAAWACGTQSGGKLSTTNCTSYQVADMPATKVSYTGINVSTMPDWGWLNSAVRTRANGDLQSASTGAVLGRVTVGVASNVELTLPPGTILTSLIGAASVNTCGTPTMTVDAMTVTP